MSEQIPKAISRFPGWAKKFLPFFVSFLILYYYFHNQNWKGLLEAISYASIWLALLGVLVPQFIYWLFEAIIYERLMKWFHGSFPFRQFFWVRGAIYILAVITTNLGFGGVLLYIQRKTLVPWMKLLGIMLFRFGLTIWGICVLLVPATLAMHYYGLDEKVRLNMWVWWTLLIFGIAWMVEAWIVWHHKKRFGLAKLVVRDRESTFWTAFRLATRRQWFLTWAMAIPPFLVMLIGFYFVTLAFDVKVPFWEFIVVSPLAMIIMDLPIAFAGFGTATLAWITFFSDYGSEENIKALTLFIPFARGLCRALIGLISLRPALKDIYTLSLLSPKGKTA